AARGERVKTAIPEFLVEQRRALRIVEIDQDYIEALSRPGEETLGGIDDDRLAQIEPAPRDPDDALVGIDQGRRAFRHIVAQDAQPRRAAEIVGHQFAQMRVARSRHQAAAGSRLAAAIIATVSPNWPSASRPFSESA